MVTRVALVSMVLLFAACSKSSPPPANQDPDAGSATSPDKAAEAPEPPTCEDTLAEPPEALGPPRSVLCSPVRSGPTRGVLKIFLAKDDTLEGLFRGHRKGEPFECAFSGALASGAFVAYGGRKETRTTCRINGRLKEGGIDGSINGRVLGKPIIATFSGRLDQFPVQP